MADRLSHAESAPRSTINQPFEFIRSRVIEIPLDAEASTLGEFYEAVANVEVGVVYNPLCESRLRRKPLSVDFAGWLDSENGLSLQELAQKVGRAVWDSVWKACEQDPAPVRPRVVTTTNVVSQRFTPVCG